MDGRSASGPSLDASISADGRYVAFNSPARDIDGSDDNYFGVDTFLWDRYASVRIISRTSTGEQANGDSRGTAISDDGRWISFSSAAGNLEDETNGEFDVFRHDGATGALDLVSANSQGGPASSGSFAPAISADGQRVAFSSYASNLVFNDTNDQRDVFYRDLQTSSTVMLSVTYNGAPANSSSYDVDLTADGSCAIFDSQATNLVPGDTGGQGIYYRCPAHGRTKLISKPSDGSISNGSSYAPSIRADGRYVTFTSTASNLVPADDNEAADVFLFDRRNNSTTLVTKGLDGTPADLGGNTTVGSVAGHYVVFSSQSPDLVASDNNQSSDVFTYDIRTGQIALLSISRDGAGANGGSDSVIISADGRHVAFTSAASNLVRRDSNRATDVFVVGLPR